MKTSRWSLIAVATVGLLAGALYGFGSAGQSATGGGTDSPQQARPAVKSVERDLSEPRRAAGKPDGPARHDFAALRKWQLDRGPGNSGWQVQLERLDKGELRALLTDSVSDAPTSDGGIMTAAAKELFRREGMAALDWGKSLPPDQRKTVMYFLLAAAVAEDPAQAKPWITEFREEIGSSNADSLIHKAIIGATSRGAEDLIKLKELYGDQIRSISFPQGALPEDFDFHRFFTGLPPSGNAGTLEAFQYWVAKDKEAAWSGFKELLDAQTKGSMTYFSSLFTGAAAVEGEAKAAEWLIPKLAGLSATDREKALSSFGFNGQVSVETVQALMPILTSDEDRRAFALRAMNPYGNPAATIATLKGLPTEELRAEVLIANLQRSGIGKSPPTPQSQKTIDFFESAMEGAGLPPETRQRVRDSIKPPAEKEQ